MKRYMRIIVVALLVILFLIETGIIMCNKKMSLHYVGSHAAKEIENCTGSIIFHIDDFLKNTDATVEQKVTILETIETYIDYCIASCNYFHHVANLMHSARGSSFLSGTYTAHDLEGAYMSEGLYVFKMFIRRCISSTIEQENTDMVREYLDEAKAEIGKVMSAFVDTEISQCKNSTDFYRKYKVLTRTTSFVNLFEVFSNYLK